MSLTLTTRPVDLLWKEQSNINMESKRTLPRLIQAGMGIRISSATLANATSRLGALGVVSSVGLRHIIVDEVREGNEETIEIAKTFPIEPYVNELLEFAPGGPKNRFHAPIDHPSPLKSELPKRLSVICAYIEVMRAKKGHAGMVGINVMWKCSLTVLPSIYGAMLAGVDALLCGAGVPMELPDIISKIRVNQNLDYLPLHGTDTAARLSISDDQSKDYLSLLNPPELIPILSNFAFPKRIIDIWGREYNGRPSAFVLENHSAGGHNAPPRNKQSFGAPDNINSYFDKVRDLGVPIYAAGAGSSRADYTGWLDRGAYGLQVGSRFALCTDSGMRDDIRKAVIRQNAEGDGEVQTRTRLSSTGYPFKVFPLASTITDDEVLSARKRICNKGYLLQARIEMSEDGSVKESYLCPAMPVAQYVKLGGAAEDAEGRCCLCNSLFATAGIGEAHEPAVVTLGEGGTDITKELTAREIVEDILGSEFVINAEAKLTQTQNWSI